MRPVRVVVIGGGISGLAAAHRLAEHSRRHPGRFELTLLEGAPRLGGVIETATREGFVLEGGPDAFITEKPAALELCHRLGLTDAVIETNPAHRRSYLVHHGRLVPVPEGLYLMAPSTLSGLARIPWLSAGAKLRMAAEWLLPARRDPADESVGAFIRRRFGRAALERIGQPMIGGIYTADPEQLSLLATMPKFREMEQRYGSVLRAFRASAHRPPTAGTSGPRYSLFVSLRGGMSTLIERLAACMPEVTIRRSALVVGLAQQAVGWLVRLAGGGALEADMICVAVPAGQAAELLAAVAPALTAQLGDIPYASVATMNLAFRNNELPKRLDGFGFVAPAVERRGLVGCTFASVKFSGRAPAGHSLVRAFLGGAMHPKVLELDDAALTAMVRRELAELVGIRAEPRFTSIRRYARAMPQYHVGHLTRVASILAATRLRRGLYLTGNAYKGIGIPDCVRHAEETADQLIQDAGFKM